MDPTAALPPSGPAVEPTVRVRELYPGVVAKGMGLPPGEWAHFRIQVKSSWISVWLFVRGFLRSVNFTTRIN